LEISSQRDESDVCDSGNGLF